mmetsp:Transcript_35685/g.107560  ORF Transcript_35685/g.107560 Transcript_35685/m.107560 type:complete len:312 (-) Transcript_35685:969-1904(-)
MAGLPRSCGRDSASAALSTKRSLKRRTARRRSHSIPRMRPCHATNNGVRRRRSCREVSATRTLPSSSRPRLYRPKSRRGSMQQPLSRPSAMTAATSDRPLRRRRRALTCRLAPPCTAPSPQARLGSAGGGTSLSISRSSIWSSSRSPTMGLARRLATTCKRESRGCIASRRPIAPEGGSRHRRATQRCPRRRCRLTLPCCLRRPPASSMATCRSPCTKSRASSRPSAMSRSTRSALGRCRTPTGTGTTAPAPLVSRTRTATDLMAATTSRPAPPTPSREPRSTTRAASTAIGPAVARTTACHTTCPLATSY